MPLTSITCAPAGTLTEATGPTAVILPFIMTSAPFSITPWLMVSSLAPRSTTGLDCATHRCDNVRIRIVIPNEVRDLQLRPEVRDPFTRIIPPPCSASFQTPAGNDRNTPRHQ